MWISDVHLGSRDCKDELLTDFLKSHDPEQIYLVGDIIDGWKMKSGIYWTKGYTKVLRRLLKLSKNGVPVYYITGNHDEFLRRFANHRFDNIHLLNRKVHTTADNRRLLVLHGDQFDGVATAHQFLRFIGDHGYELLMKLNRVFNWFRQRYGYGYWSLAAYLKHHIKRARMHIQEYEHGAAYAARSQGFDGVVCGHIHHAADKMIDGVHYYNTGDWVESCTGLVERFDGQIELVDWLARSKEVAANQEPEVAPDVSTTEIPAVASGPAAERLDSAA
ncbi:MAG: UDP-2,3-diacylglucosamine diphosphatase [bacterium]